MTPTQSPQTNPLDQLKDIHLPEAVSWWPPAIGWWILAVLIISLVVVLTHLMLRTWRNTRYKRQALKQLQKLKNQAHSGENDIQALAQLLRQTAIAANIAGVKQMHGQQWQQLLQQHMPEPQAHLLAIARYQQGQQKIADEALYQAVGNWIKKHKKGADI